MNTDQLIDYAITEATQGCTVLLATWYPEVTTSKVAAQALAAGARPRGTDTRTRYTFPKHDGRQGWIEIAKPNATYRGYTPAHLLIDPTPPNDLATIQHGMQQDTPGIYTRHNPS